MTVAVLVGGNAAAAQPPPALVVRQAVPDPTTDTLTIDGEHFGPTPFVTLDLVPLDLLALDTRLMAAVPLEPLPPGRYLLTVSRGPGPGDRATIEVPLGGPAEPPAEAPAASQAGSSRVSPSMPAPGDVAAVVGDRTITIAEVDREWQTGDPGGYVALMRELHTARRQVADRLATAAVVAREAAARGMSAEALLAEEVPKRAVPMPDTALSALYESLGGRTRGAAFERMRPSLRAWVERKTEPELAKMTYVEELVKTSTRLEMRLAAPVVEVDARRWTRLVARPRHRSRLSLSAICKAPTMRGWPRRSAASPTPSAPASGSRSSCCPPSGRSRSRPPKPAPVPTRRAGSGPSTTSPPVPARSMPRRLKAIPAEAGLDQALLDRCLSAGTFRERVRHAAAEARRYGISHRSGAARQRPVGAGAAAVPAAVRVLHAPHRGGAPAPGAGRAEGRPVSCSPRASSMITA